MRIGALFKKAWVAIFFAAGLIYVAYYFLALAPRLTHTVNPSPGLLWLAVAIQIACLLLLAQLWRSVLSGVSAARLTLLQSMAQLALVGIGKYLPGKIWGMVARGAHVQRYGFEASAALLATYHEQALLLHAAVLTCATLIAWLYHWHWLAVIAIASLLSGPLLLHRLWGVFTWLAALSQRMTTAPRFTHLSLRRYLYLSLGYSLNWLINGLALAVIYYSCFTRPFTFELLGTLVLANTAGISLGFFALFAPGGIGVREAVTSALLAQHMPLADAALLSVLYRFWLIAWDLALGGLFALYHLYNRNTCE